MNYVLLKEDIFLKNWQTVKLIAQKIKQAVQERKEGKIVEIPLGFSKNVQSISLYVTFKKLNFFKNNSISFFTNITYINPSGNKIYFSSWDNKKAILDLIFIFYILKAVAFFKYNKINEPLETLNMSIFIESVHFCLFTIYVFSKFMNISIDLKKILFNLKNLISDFYKIGFGKKSIYDLLTDLKVIQKTINNTEDSIIHTIFSLLNDGIRELLYHFFKLPQNQQIQILKSITTISKKVNDRAKKDAEKSFAYAKRIIAEI